MGSRPAKVPGHEAIRAAVDGDVELDGWTSAASEYVLVPVSFSGASNHDFFELTPLTVSHPNGVLLARSTLDGAIQFTTGRPQAVWNVLRADPGLVEPNTIVQLLGPFDQVEYLGPGSEPAVEQVDDGWRCDLRVREVPDGEIRRWRVLLAGEPAWRIE